MVSSETSPTAHHPNCNLGGQASVDREMVMRDNDSLDLYFMSPDAYRAAEAIEFIAEHLRIEDRYIQVSFFLHFYYHYYCYKLQLDFTSFV